MGSLGVQEMVVIAILAFLVFGPERLPEVARNAGKLVARFREETGRSLDELKRAADVDGLGKELTGLRDEFGRAKADLKGSIDVVTRAANDAAATPVRRVSPPPFDPEAT